MERFKIQCKISNRPVELQFDIKKIPGEVGPCYMVSIDGMFRGYIIKEKSGGFAEFSNSDLTEDDLLAINEQLKLLTN